MAKKLLRVVLKLDAKVDGMAKGRFGGSDERSSTVAMEFPIETIEDFDKINKPENFQDLVSTFHVVSKQLAGHILSMFTELDIVNYEL